MTEQKLNQLQEYKKMLDEGLITKEEFATLKIEVLQNTDNPSVSRNPMHIVNDVQKETHISDKNPSENDSNIFKILGFISAGLALLFIPILFGTLGAIFGIITKNREKDSSIGSIIIALSIGSALLGSILGAIVGANIY